MEGKLMVAKRQGFQKVYDLTERVLPAKVNIDRPTEDEFSEYLIKKAIQANGIVEEKEVYYLRKGMKEPVNKVLKRMLKEGSVIEVQLETNDKLRYITTAEQLKSIEKIKLENQIQILSPFDNVLIQRKRVVSLFDFDYQIECYVPEPKRKFGYFCLPVLHGDKFVARFDPKGDRASKVFYIKCMHFEKGFKPDENFNNLFAQKLIAYVTFTGCDKIKIEKADKVWKKDMNILLK